MTARAKSFTKTLGIIGAAVAAGVSIWGAVAGVAVFPYRLNAVESRIAETERQQQVLSIVAARIDENVKWLMRREESKSGVRAPNQASDATPPSSRQ